MLRLIFSKVAAARIKNPKAGNVSLFMNENGEPRLKKSDGTDVPVGAVGGGNAIFDTIIGTFITNGPNVAPGFRYANSDDPNFYGNLSIQRVSAGLLKLSFNHSINHAIVTMPSGNNDVDRLYSFSKQGSYIFVFCKNAAGQGVDAFIDTDFTFMIRKDAY